MFRFRDALWVLLLLVLMGCESTTSESPSLLLPTTAPTPEPPITMATACSFVNKKHVYLVQQRSLSVINVSDPENPFEEARQTLLLDDQNMSQPCIQGDYGYFKTEANAFTLHFTNPLSATIVLTTPLDQPSSQWQPPASRGEMQMWNGFAYYIHTDWDYRYRYSSKSLRLLDVHDPKSPTARSFSPSIDVAGYATLARQSNRLFLIDGEPANAHKTPGFNRYRLIDIENPIQPSVVLTQQLNLYVTGAVASAIEGHYLYVTSFNAWPAAESALNVIDIADPLHPKLVGLWRSMCNATSPGWSDDLSVLGYCVVVPFGFAAHANNSIFMTMKSAEELTLRWNIQGIKAAYLYQQADGKYCPAAIGDTNQRLAVFGNDTFRIQANKLKMGGYKFSLILVLQDTTEVVHAERFVCVTAL